jgi:hypothetical protein
MFNLFDIGKPAVKEEPAKVTVYKPTVKPFVKKAPSPTIDAMKRLEKVMDQIQHLNSPKADAMRKLYFYLQSTNDNPADLIAFLKQPIAKRKKTKKV